MNKLILITAFVLLGALASSAGAGLFTGCISPEGELKNVAVGEEPSQSCGKTDTLKHWVESEEELVAGSLGGHGVLRSEPSLLPGSTPGQINNHRGATRSWCEY
jgi:hypothetical protein